MSSSASKRRKTTDTAGSKQSKRARTRVEPSGGAPSKAKPAAAAATQAREKRAKQEREKKERKDRLYAEMIKRNAEIHKAVEEKKYKPAAIILSVSGEPAHALLFPDPSVLSQSDYEQFIACNGQTYSEDDLVKTGRLVDDDDGDDSDDEENAAADGGDHSDDSDYNDDDDGEGDGGGATTNGDLAEETASKKEKQSKSKSNSGSSSSSAARAKRRRALEAKEQRNLQTSTRELITRLKNTGAGGLGAKAIVSTVGLVDFTGWWVFLITSIDEVA